MTLHPTHRRHPDHPTQIFNIFFSVGFERGSDPEERTLVVLCTCLSHTPETTHTRRTHTLHGAAPPHRRTALKPQQPRDHHATHQNRKEPSGEPLSQSPPALSLSSPLLPRYPLVSAIPYGPERKPERTDTFPFHVVEENKQPHSRSRTSSPPTFDHGYHTIRFDHC